MNNNEFIKELIYSSIKSFQLKRNKLIKNSREI